MADKAGRGPGTDNPKIVARNGDGNADKVPEVKLAPGHWAIMAVCVLAVIVTVGFNIVGSRDRAGQLREQEAELSVLDSQLEVQRAANDEKEVVTVMEITGLDRHRVEVDDNIAERFFEKVLTWDDFDTYDANRSELISKYGLDEDGNFLTTFYPEVYNYVDDDGVGHNSIDSQDLNMRYEGIVSHVRMISGGLYSYIAEVTYSSVSVEYGYRGSNQVVVFYTVDADGNISGLDAYTVR